MKKIILIFVVALLFACNGKNEEVKVQDPTLGQWRAAPWYCDNEFLYPVIPSDINSYLTFEIVSYNDQGTLQIQDINWYLPSESSDIIFTDTGPCFIFIDTARNMNDMYLNFHTNPPYEFQFIGSYQNEKYIGAVTRTYDNNGQKTNQVFTYNCTVEKIN